MQVEDFLADLRSVLIDREGQYGEAGKSFRRIAQDTVLRAVRAARENAGFCNAEREEE